MMTIRKTFRALPVAVLAGALALAGCDGESGPSRLEALATTSLMTTDTAYKAATEAFEVAFMNQGEESDEPSPVDGLTAASVNGESSMAMANAKKVLDANKKVDAQLAVIDKVIDQLEGELEVQGELGGTGLAPAGAGLAPAGPGPGEEEIEALKRALKDAKEHRDKIMNIMAGRQPYKQNMESKSLTAAVMRVEATGDDGSNGDQDSVATMVATEVDEASRFPIGKGGRYPGEMPAVADKGASVITSTTDLPTNEMQMKMMNKMETDYAHYGYWNEVNPAGDEIIKIHAFGIPKTEHAMNANGSLAISPSMPATATYNGKALGMSIMTNTDGMAQKSGKFTADVELTAEFGASPMVSGMINNFQGNAVGENWKITLENASLLDNAEPSISNANHWGETLGASGTDNADNKGRWHARAYGGTNAARPKGITGTFRALFPDGRALGGYDAHMMMDDDQ